VKRKENGFGRPTQKYPQKTREAGGNFDQKRLNSYR
jgi:hypothetical protein